MSALFSLQNQIAVLVFLGVTLVIALANLLALRRLERYDRPRRCPRLAVLVPARNEEANIAACLRSLLAQDYADFEVLVLDDHSADRTGEILAALAAEDGRLRVLAGRPLPADWLGKHWACHQLAQATDAELILFTDADTRHHPQTLRRAVAAMEAAGADFLTMVPHELLGSWGERLVVPVLLWAFCCFVPLALAIRLRAPIFSAAIGQFMLLRRAAYEQVGGHAAVRQDVVDDLALGRRFKAHGRRWYAVDGMDYVRCRMYQNWRQVYDGFSKNLFAAFGYRIVPFVFVWLWMLFVCWGPWVLLAFRLAGTPIPVLNVALAAAAILASLLVWGIAYIRFRFPLYLALLYPVSTALMAAIAARSLVLALRGRATWSGRVLVKPRVRLF